MPDAAHPIFVRLSRCLPGWLLLIAGMALVATPALLPTWLECRELAWRRGLMEVQAERMARQRDNYEKFLLALDENDAVLLERLAFHQFHLKPVGAEVLRSDDGDGDRSFDPVTVNYEPARARGAAAANVSPHESPNVEAWLAEPMPVVGQDYPRLATLDTRLIRLCRGPARVLLFAAGGVCLLAGMTLSPRTDR